jgi:uncharacterized protein (DUF433 family)
MYDEALAARVLGVPQSTLHYWLEGGEQRGHRYEPVLRTVATGVRTVTWGEYVEARYLREYRRTLGAPLANLRAFISFLREELGVPYPLAHAQPWVGPGRHLFVAAQDQAELPQELWAVVEPHTGVTMLLPESGRFLDRVEFNDQENGVVVRVRPDGPTSPVLIDPELRFGAPTVKGIPTESLAEQVRAGDSIEGVADDFGLELGTVIAALSYEGLGQQSAA